ncbi:putative galactolipase [Helianthus debilis subsp. tardiflorus]
MREYAEQNHPENHDIPSFGYMVLSLGTGVCNMQGKYNASEAKKWGLFGWFAPLLDIFTSTASDMDDFHLSSVFKNRNRDKHIYLRIQVFFFTAHFPSYIYTHESIKLINHA